jgi:DNA-binding transcriptional regulator YhcF (GntR family)
MAAADELRERLRRRIVGQVHVGRLAPGDRLPSIRRLKDEWEVDHRALAAAYRALEEDGLVEVRPGSGVYVAGHEPDGTPPETVRWLAGVLVEGWVRRMPRREAGRLVQRCATAPLACAVVESNEDSMVALAAELEEDFSLDVLRIPMEPDTDALDPARLEEAELVVTSVFHAEAAREAAAAAGKPLVVSVLNPDFTEALDRRLSGGPLTAVISDPAFRARGEAFLRETAHRGRVRFVPVDQLAFAIPEVDLDDAERVVVTRAARRRLGLPEFHLLPPPATLVSPATARELSRLIVRLALAR